MQRLPRMREIRSSKAKLEIVNDLKPAEQRDLEVPPEVERDAKAREVFRGWVANGGFVCALRPETWKNRASWGLVLADAARHIGNAIAELDGTNPAVTVQSIRKIFNEELDSPTDQPTGNFY
jgi:hypothetical protein